MSGSKLLDKVTFAKESVFKDPINNIIYDRKDIKGRLRVLKKTKKTLKGIEKDAEIKLSSEIALLKGQLKSHKLGLPIFDINILSWTRENGEPIFAIFGLDAHSIRINASYKYSRIEKRRGKNVWVSPKVTYISLEPYVTYYNHSEIEMIYSGAIEKNLPEVADAQEWRLKYSTEFKGVIPYAIKEKIKKFKRAGKFFIVAEVSKWGKSLEEDQDPLVLLYDGLNYFLVDSFDTTNIEEYVGLEFSRKG